SGFDAIVLSHAGLVEAALAAARGMRLSVSTGSSITVDELAAGADEKSAHHAWKGHDIVEMESFWVGEVAAKRGLPFLAVRAIAEAIRRTQDYFLRTQRADGYWVGELETNVCMAAEYLLLTHFLGIADDERWRKVATYLKGRQSADGTWTIYFGGPPDLNATVEAYFALKLAGASPDDPYMRRAREFVL